MRVIITGDEGIVFGEYDLYDYIKDVEQDYARYFPKEPGLTAERLYKEGVDELIGAVESDIRHLARDEEG
jgi:hypothetical protein